MKIEIRGTLCLALLAVTSVAVAQNPPAGGTAQKKLYCWNEGGRKVCGDALPASAVNSARTEISGKSGLPGTRIDRAMTPEERAAAEARAAEAKAQAAQAAADQRRDLALAESYESEAALRHAFKIRYELVEEGLKTSKMAIDNQRLSLIRLLEAAADAEMKTGKVPPKLAQNILAQRAIVLDAQQTYQTQQHERTRIDQQLQEALARYRKAKGLDPVTGQPPVPTVAPNAG